MRPVSQNVLSAVSPTLHAVFAKHAKTANDRAENGSGLSEKKNRPHTLKCSWRNVQKPLWAWTPKWRFLKGAGRSLHLYLVHTLHFIMRKCYQSFLSETRGGRRMQRQWWRRKISLRSLDSHIARRLHSTPVEDKRWNLGIRPIDGVASKLSTQPLNGYYPA